MTPEDANRLDGPVLADMAEDYRPPMPMGARVFWVCAGVGWAAAIMLVWEWVYG
jgi:hypothetical protein